MLPGLWAVAIIATTSVPGRAVPQVGIAHVDKLVHFVLYGVLGLLLARSLRGGRAAPGARLAVRRLLAWAAGIALFAAADEWHQDWVPGRSADLMDWFADVVGGTLALLLAARPVARPEHLT